MDEELLETLYAAAYRRLVGQLYGVCGDLSEAEDVVQEAFVQALRHRRKVEAAENPEAWLRRVAVNRARSRWRRRVLGEALLRSQGRADQADTGPGVGLSEDRIALVSAVRRLPARQREAVGLHYLADLSVQDVAATLEAPLGSVKAWLSRGRAALAADPALVTHATDIAARTGAVSRKEVRNGRS